MFIQGFEKNVETTLDTGDISLFWLVLSAEEGSGEF